ncbi:hypothetical protein [Streptomyces sp. 3N207]|uniref:hypothetical protein n=1 Tax=Streptomyces sp. 3N207 TaxID=3457417 RepID=UPI003FD1E89B
MRTLSGVAEVCEAAEETWDEYDRRSGTAAVTLAAPHVGRRPTGGRHGLDWMSQLPICRLADNVDSFSGNGS